MRSQPDADIPDMPATLREIVEHKLGQVRAARAAEPIEALTERIADAPPARDFVGALAGPHRPAQTRIIAEVKRKSPSAGLIRPEYDRDGFMPEVIAQQYSTAGASAISCLTDEKFFAGHLSFINRIKARTGLPVLRKDFIIDAYQIHQARAYGADAVLLIAECLTDDQIRGLLETSAQLGLGVLLEVHLRQNLLRVQPMLSQLPHPVLLGINNRDLTRMVTDLAHTTELLDLVENPDNLVSESGIRSAADLARLRESGVHIALVGEHLMRQPDPAAALSDLLAGSDAGLGNGGFPDHGQ